MDQIYQINLMISSLSHKVCFHVKILLFVTAKYEQDPDPYPHGSVFVWLPGSWFRNEVKSWIKSCVRHY
jgi:hypothetical protein